MRISSNGDFNKPVLLIRLKVSGSIIGYDGIRDLSKSAEVKKVENMMETNLVKQINQLMGRFHKLGVEPCGLKEAFRRRYPGKWTRQVGDAAIKRAKIIAIPDVEIVSIGTIR